MDMGQGAKGRIWKADTLLAQAPWSSGKTESRESGIDSAFPQGGAQKKEVMSRNKNHGSEGRMWGMGAV